MYNEQTSTSSSSSYDTSRDTHERLILHKRPYLCTIPYVAPPVTDSLNSNGTSQSAEDEKTAELARATEHGLELLKDMQGQCIYYYAGWWVYAFCYNEFVKQFHPLPPGRGVPPFPPFEDTSVGSYLLGRFPAHKTQEDSAQDPTTQENDLTPAKFSSLETAGSTSFLSQRLDGGTTCDLTGTDRRIEVQFHCNPASPDRIHMIKETSSCVYLMVIHTARLCNDVAFMPPQTEKPHAIACREIVSTAEDEADWRTRTSSAANEQMQSIMSKQEALVDQMHGLANQMLGGNPAAQQQTRPLVIGGITVGAQNLVGSTPELTISASSIIGSTSPQQNGQSQGHREEFLATLARYDGKYTSSLSISEMKKLGLEGTHEELEKWIRHMQKRAGEGVPWRLDVVKVDGREFQFRGILGTEDSDDERRAKAEAKAKEAAKQFLNQGAGREQRQGQGRGQPQEEPQFAPRNGEDEAEFYGDDHGYEHEQEGEDVYYEDDNGNDPNGEGSQEEFI